MWESERNRKYKRKIHEKSFKVVLFENNKNFIADFILLELIMMNKELHVIEYEHEKK